MTPTRKRRLAQIAVANQSLTFAIEVAAKTREVVLPPKAMFAAKVWSEMEIADLRLLVRLARKAD